MIITISQPSTILTLKGGTVCCVKHTQDSETFSRVRVHQIFKQELNQQRTI